MPLKQPMGPTEGFLQEEGNSTVRAAVEQALTEQPVEGKRLARVRRRFVEPDPDQPRTVFKPDEIAALRASILSEGQLQPIDVYEVEAGRYRISRGEKRWHAMYDFDFIDIAIGEKPTREKNYRRQLAENIQRGDFVLLDVCRAIVKLKDEFGDTHKQIADTDMYPYAKGVDTWVGNRYRMMKRIPLDPITKEPLTAGGKAVFQLMVDFKDVFGHVDKITSGPQEKWVEAVKMVRGNSTEEKRGATVDQIEDFMKPEKAQVKQDKKKEKERVQLQAGGGFIIHRSSAPAASSAIHADTPTTTPPPAPSLTEEVEEELEDDLDNLSEEERATIVNAAFAEIGYFENKDKKKVTFNSISTSAMAATKAVEWYVRDLPEALKLEDITPLALEALKTQVANLAAFVEEASRVVNEQ